MENGSVPESGSQAPGGASKVLKFRTQFNKEYSGASGEVFTLPSKTVPDQSLTVAQLLLNHTRGIEFDVAEYEGEYFEDVPIPRVDDITDLAVSREYLVGQQLDLEEEIKKEVQRKKAQKDEITRNLESGPNPFTSSDRNNHSTDGGETEDVK